MNIKNRIDEMNEVQELMGKDERCIRINEKACCKASKIMSLLLIISLFIVGINDFYSLPTFIIASLCVINFGLVSYYYYKYNKID